MERPASRTNFWSWTAAISIFVLVMLLCAGVGLLLMASALSGGGGPAGQGPKLPAAVDYVGWLVVRPFTFGDVIVCMALNALTWSAISGGAAFAMVRLWRRFRET